MAWRTLALMGALAAAPPAIAGETFSDPWQQAFYDYAYHLQDEAFLMGICERHRDKAELDGLADFLAKPSIDGARAKMVTETRKAFEAGQAQAERRNWTPELCERAISETRDKALAARAELDRLDAAAGR